MNLNPQDRRSRRTRKALRLALAELMEELPDDQITIRALAGRADIAYTTFFRHYESKNAVYLDLAEPEIECFSELTRHLFAADDRPSAIQKLTAYVGSKRSLWQALLTSGGAPAFRGG